MNEVINATVNDEKESPSFSKLNAYKRMRELRKKYGGEKGFSEVSGLGIAMIKKYCSESYMKKSNFKQSTWEKYFGPWEDKEPTFMMKRLIFTKLKRRIFLMQPLSRSRQRRKKKSLK